MYLDWELLQREKGRSVGGRTAYFYSNWEKITNDQWILEAISGYHLEFLSSPHQRKWPKQHVLEEEKSEALEKELEALIQKEAVSKVQQPEGSFVSPMFPVPKGDGSWRPIIDLRELNQFITPHHFKMEGIRTLKGLIQKNDWMVKLDMKDAYLSVPIHPAHQHYLCFQWQGELWKFQSLPFGLRSAPYVFTKILKPVTALLRKLGIRCILYLDDMLIMAQDKKELLSQLSTAMELLILLGFVINTKKSICTPKQTMEFLGFEINSKQMSMALPGRKVEEIKRSVRRLKSEKVVTTKQLARLLGLMVAAHPAVLPAPIYYRQLQWEKIKIVRQWGYDSRIKLPVAAREELDWWLHSLSQHNGSSLQISQWDLTIETDASTQGWGASCQGVNTGGPWTRREKENHINYLELFAAFLALQVFTQKVTVTSILLRMDNVTAIAHVNKMGGTHSPTMSRLAIEIWKWCIARSIRIHAEHLPGKENVRADWESRHCKDSSDWKLDNEVFARLDETMGPFTIDLFASRTNRQLPIYCSWRPDPSAHAVDAFSIQWTNHYPYLFPPFALINRCIEKIKEERVEAVLIAPVWQNQVWYPILLETLANEPVLLPMSQDILQNPQGEPHPLVTEGHLPLAAWPISGNNSAPGDFLKELLQSSGSHGGTRQNQLTVQSGGNGTAGVLHGICIQFQHL